MAQQFSVLRGVDDADLRERVRALTSELLKCEERERRRISGYLNDRVGQELVLLRMFFSVMARSDDPAKKARAVEQINGLLDGAIANIETLVCDLSPPALYEFGLAAALEWLGEKVADEHGLVFEMTIEGTPKTLCEDSAALLFQLTRELLMNVVKHARAAHVRAGLRWYEDFVEIEVKDDGTGFDLSTLEARGNNMSFGLFSVRERVESLDGRVEIDSAASEGTRISLTVPLPNEEGKQSWASEF